MLHHPPSEVEFEEVEEPVADQGRDGQLGSHEQLIKLEISDSEEEETKDWDIYPVNSVEVECNALYNYQDFELCLLSLRKYHNI